MNTTSKSTIHKPKSLLSLKRFKHLKDNPFAIFDKVTNSVYHAGSIADAEVLCRLLNELAMKNLPNEKNPVGRDAPELSHEPR